MIYPVPSDEQAAPPVAYDDHADHCGAMILDHVGIGVGDYARAKAFYTAALAPLGIALVMEVEQEQLPGHSACGFGRAGKPEFWIGSEGKTTPPAHVAFVAESRAAVRAFYEAALRAGGRDNGPPGLRPQYHPSYYGAFVLDLDGHNVEAVCHAPE
jgi:catechol 2,3-dioxygenase-like lactoylglutathione lyase family enzyme